MFADITSHDEIWAALLSCSAQLRSLFAGRTHVTDDLLYKCLRAEKNPVRTAALQLLLDPVQRAEKRCPFSGVTVVETALGHLEKLSRLPKVDRQRAAKDIREGAQKACSREVASARVPDSSEVWSLVRRAVRDQLAIDLVIELTARGGLDGKYSIEPGTGTVAVIESTLGYNFSLPCAADTRSWSRREVKALLVDGVVESVHEIHHALEQASQQKFPILIAARGFGDDVVQTLKVNQKRGTVDSLALLVPMEVESLNTLADLSAVMGCDVVSSAKGQLISSAKISDSPAIDSVSYRQGVLTICNRSTDAAVQAHRMTVIRRGDEVQAELRRFYDSRAKSLTPNHTAIKLPKTYDALGTSSLAQRVSAGMRFLRAISECGVVGEGDSLDSSLRKAVGVSYAVSQIESICSLDCLIRS